MRKTIAAAVIGACLATPAAAQTINNEGRVARSIGVYDDDKYGVFGMFEVSGNKPVYFGKLAVHRELRGGFEAVGETQKKKGEAPEFAFGVGYDMPLPRRAYANIHFLPLHLDGSRVTKEMTVEGFGGIDIGRGYYAEMRGELPFAGERKPSIDVALGKEIKKGLSAEIQVSVGSTRTVRAGIRKQVR